MKVIFCWILIFILAACNQPNTDVKSMQSQIDSLQRKLNQGYKPGLGEFMLGMQIHHGKLWFAGNAGNWSLSDFETKELREAIDDIQSYCSDRPEVVSIPMIKPALDSMDTAISYKSISRFKSSFVMLTNTCNNCHKVTKHEFNVVQIPSTPPFTNQVFQNSPN